MSREGLTELTSQRPIVQIAEGLGRPYSPGVLEAPQHCLASGFWLLGTAKEDSSPSVFLVSFTVHPSTPRQCICLEAEGKKCANYWVH